MSRVAFPLVLQSPVTGSAIVGAKATVTKHEVGKSLGSGPEAEIFTAETGGSTIGDSIVTDNTGRWTQGEGAGYAQYWLPEGTYDIAISGSGLTTVVITRELASGNTLSSVAVHAGGAGTVYGAQHNGENEEVAPPVAGRGALVGLVVNLTGSTTKSVRIKIELNDGTSWHAGPQPGVTGNGLAIQFFSVPSFIVTAAGKWRWVNNGGQELPSTVTAHEYPIW